MGIKKKHSVGCQCCGEGCTCTCILVELFDIGSDCCTELVDREFTLAQTAPQACEWEYAEDDICSQGGSDFNLSLNATLSGTTLTLLVTITKATDPSNNVTYTLTGTVPENCPEWFRESLEVTDTEANGAEICDNPPFDIGTARVSLVSCDCPYCTSLPGEIELHLQGFSEDTSTGETLYGDCCSAITGDWVLPWIGGCEWEASFDICDDQLSALIHVEIREETEDAAVVDVYLQIFDAMDVLQMEVQWTSQDLSYPTDCSAFSLDLGTFTVHDAPTGDMDCHDPPTSPGCNVIDPDGQISFAECVTCCEEYRSTEDCEEQCAGVPP